MLTKPKVRIVSAICGTCEKWACGVGQKTKPLATGMGFEASVQEGMCTNYYSPLHRTQLEFDQTCPNWIPADDTLATRQ